MLVMRAAHLLCRYKVRGAGVGPAWLHLEKHTSPVQAGFGWWQQRLLLRRSPLLK